MLDCIFLPGAVVVGPYRVVVKVGEVLGRVPDGVADVGVLHLHGVVPLRLQHFLHLVEVESAWEQGKNGPSGAVIVGRALGLTRYDNGFIS